jgi:RNA dependent RNA polymerase
MPNEIVDPADYPRVSPEDIGRAVELRDMAHFFVEYMENDKLGVISNMHLQMADLLPKGTQEQACINLAQMASIAVDYAKTGIKVCVASGCL